MKTIEELRASLLKIGEQLGGGIRPNYYFTIPDQSDGVGTPYLEIGGEVYHFVASERGIEFNRKSTLDYEDVLYWFTDDGVRALASEYAASNKIRMKNSESYIFESNFI
ncbi:Imm63 family immunity protein [Pantoea sp. BS_4]|uniref:Imm63 family immunity protein n=1 Tax=unclassified Pantoea TaxID=2630326 RepID=UPI0035C13A34